MRRAVVDQRLYVIEESLARRGATACRAVRLAVLDVPTDGFDEVVKDLFVSNTFDAVARDFQLAEDLQLRLT